MIPAGILAGINQIQARLIHSYGVGGYQNANVGHAGVLRYLTAVAVYTHVLHYVHINRVAAEVIYHGAGSVCHGFQKGIVIRRPELCRVTGAVDQCLAVGGSNADGQLLQRTAKAAHGMTFEV